MPQIVHVAKPSLLARTLPGGVVHRPNRPGVGLFAALTMIKAQQLGKLAAELPAATLSDEGAARTLASVQGIVGIYLAPYT